MDRGESNHHQLNPAVGLENLLQPGSDKSAVDRFGKHQLAGFRIDFVPESTSRLTRGETRGGIRRVVLHNNSGEVATAPPI
jgi:hypothetical protein